MACTDEYGNEGDGIFEIEVRCRTDSSASKTVRVAANDRESAEDIVEDMIYDRVITADDLVADSCGRRGGRDGVQR